ncbi:MAG: stage II sporulation protein D [Clostridiaceae bacterium]|nr:stage II sporulation protein D [Clostridiaceae bacterium]
MKRLLIIMTALMLIVFMMPLVTVGLDGGTTADDIKQPDEDGAVLVDDNRTFDEKTEITLWDEEQVKTMSLREYLCGVVAAEMPSSFPEEALKAQALAARTYTMYQLKLYEDGMAIPERHHGAQLCSDHTHCKAFCDLTKKKTEMWGANADFYYDKVQKAVDDTCGIIATYKGEPIAAVFHSTSSEKTESAVSVWGTDTPYLVSVESPGSEESPKYKGEVVISEEEFKEKMLQAHPEMDFSESSDCWFRASNRSEAGGVIDVAVGGVRVSGVWLRQVLGLNSTNFTYKPQDGMLYFNTTGYGHGVGMSQYGAKALAEEGKTYDEIIKWYYSGVDLTIKS